MDTGLMVNVNTEYGDILVFRKEKYARQFANKVKNLDYERPVFDILTKEKYDVFIDIGASFGIHSIMASHFAKRVYAFEAQPLLFGFLNWNTRDLENVIAHDFFIGSNDNDPKMFGNMHGMVGIEGKHRHVDLKKATIVPLNDILDLCNDNEKIIIKIDTEGNEEDILSSGINKINKMSNLEFIVELHPWASTEDSLFSHLPNYNHKLIYPGKKSSIYRFYK